MWVAGQNRRAELPHWSGSTAHATAHAIPAPRFTMLAAALSLSLTRLYCPHVYCCPVLPPTEVPQAAAYLEVRVLHCLCPGRISAPGAQAAAHRRSTSDAPKQQQQTQLMQQRVKEDTQLKSCTLCCTWQQHAAVPAQQLCCTTACCACNRPEQVVLVHCLVKSWPALDSSQ